MSALKLTSEIQKHSLEWELQDTDKGPYKIKYKDDGANPVLCVEHPYNGIPFDALKEIIWFLQSDARVPLADTPNMPVYFSESDE